MVIRGFEELNKVLAERKHQNRIAWMKRNKVTYEEWPRFYRALPDPYPEEGEELLFDMFFEIPNKT